jgi:hypothetical protein
MVTFVKEGRRTPAHGLKHVVLADAWSARAAVTMRLTQLPHRVICDPGGNGSPSRPGYPRSGYDVDNKALRAQSVGEMFPTSS